MGKLELNKKMKKDALFNTAFELFTTKGLAKTTISDIVEKAGVAKGTFYLYFQDKYDIRNKLITHKTAELFSRAHQELKQRNLVSFEEQLLFLVDHILDELEQNHSLLVFISKNLSWGVFKGAFTEPLEEDPADDSEQFFDSYMNLITETGVIYRNPEIMLYTIVELVGSTCYSCIMFQQPVSLEEYRPHLHQSIHGILETFRIQKEE